MSLRLAAPARLATDPAWMAVPLLLAVLAFGALLLAHAPEQAPLQADVPAVGASLPVAA
jgi:hypothetical protein